MTLKGEHSVVAYHAASVVGDLDQLLPARLDIDLDARGPGVEGVLKQLLDYRGRPLHHFAGGDLVGHGFGENVDLAHRWSVASGQWPVSQMGRRKTKRTASIRDRGGEPGSEIMQPGSISNFFYASFCF